MAVPGFVGLCPDTGKRMFDTRKSARASRKTLHDKGISVYRCAGCGYWHFGHLARQVVTGQVTRADMYGRAS